VAIGAIAAAAFPALGAAEPTYTPKGCFKPRIEPRLIAIACGDGNFYLHANHYSFYNKREAGATGKAFVNDCDPDCAGGTIRKYPVKIHLFKPRRAGCGGRRVKYFHKVALTWKDGSPPGIGRHSKHDIYCSP
jgi:hypothetical protein